MYVYSLHLSTEIIERADLFITSDVKLKNIKEIQVVVLKNLAKNQL